MKLAYLSCFFLLTILSTSSFGQSFEVPSNYTLNVAEDYKIYEKEIIAAAKWLKETPLDEQLDKRKDVSAFVMQWVNGSPTVNVELNSIIMDFEKKNNGMLILYMASCARYVLENSYSKDMRAKQKYSLNEMVEVYKSGKGIKKDKKMDKLVKSQEEGKMDEWLSDNLKVNYN